MQIFLHIQLFLNQRDWGIHNILRQSMSKGFGSLQGLRLCTHLRHILKLVHKRRTPSAVRFIEGSGLADERAEVGLVVLLGHRLVPVALCREQIWEPEHIVFTSKRGERMKRRQNLWRNSGSYRLTGRATRILAAGSCSLSSTCDRFIITKTFYKLNLLPNPPIRV